MRCCLFSVNLKFYPKRPIFGKHGHLTLNTPCNTSGHVGWLGHGHKHHHLPHGGRQEHISELARVHGMGRRACPAAAASPSSRTVAGRAARAWTPASATQKGLAFLSRQQ